MQLQCVIAFVCLLSGAPVLQSSSQPPCQRVSYIFYSYGGFEDTYDLLICGAMARYSKRQAETTLTPEPNKEYYHPSESYDWYYDRSIGKITEVRHLPDGHTLVGEHSPTQFNWRITDETKMIAGRLAVKAIGNNAFDRFNWTENWKAGDIIAYYLPDFPVPFGPEKYEGLPGLIVEIAYTERSDVSVKLGAIEEVASEILSGAFTGIKVGVDTLSNPYALKSRWLKNQPQDTLYVGDMRSRSID